jgi:hypothetical protein
MAPENFYLAPEFSNLVLKNIVLILRVPLKNMLAPELFLVLSTPGDDHYLMR